MAVNQMVCSQLKQRFVIRFLRVKNGKPGEIYRRMYDVHEETSFSQNIYKSAKYGFST